MSVKVALKGHGTFWLVGHGNLDDINDGGIAVLDPKVNGLDTNGDVVNGFAGLNTYAHLFGNGTIYRLGKVIGTKADLTQVTSEEKAA